MFWMAMGLLALVGLLIAMEPPGPFAEPTAVDIVKRRYARGEIDRETFEQMLDDLDARKPVA